MIDDFENKEARSSGELWSEICSTLPDVEEAGRGDEAQAQFTDSFHPSSRIGPQSNGISAGPWEPMEDSDIYIASLENRLKRLKGQSSEVTSREMLRSLSQAKKECWDRFLHDAQTSELFQGGEIDGSALEHLKRWLLPEKVAISAEELEFLLLPSHRGENVTSEPETSPGPDTTAQSHQAGTQEQEQGEGTRRVLEDCPTPEK
ncbi:coiled-coil domain-containing protein 32 [Hypomesus transpacificus]|uniref:coiled-coil domain-containing protein 32 n=1 Tax=Hypomesus transpacificus TaxID=137520 RepID=UPI001F076245|nr:coiled-coil domain-containing protein 32 [Hypomesus transpacificus]